MIEITRNWDGERYVLHAKGHAEDAPRGKSLVCAATSILLYTLRQVLREKAKAVEIYRIESGNVWLSAMVGAEDVLCLRGIESGLKLLAQHYPESVQMTMREPWEMSGSTR